MKRLLMTVNFSGLPVIRAKLFHNIIITVSSKVGGARGGQAQLGGLLLVIERMLMKTFISAAPEKENRVSTEQASPGSFASPSEGTGC